MGLGHAAKLKWWQLAASPHNAKHRQVVVAIIRFEYRVSASVLRLEHRSVGWKDGRQA
jgi:hypothetical protein